MTPNGDPRKDTFNLSKIGVKTLSTTVVTFANSLDSDQARLFVVPDLGPNCLTQQWYSLFS